MHISNDIRYIGVNDHQIDLFEGQYIVPNGMAYNSYVIMDEKIAVLDTVDQHFGADWFANLEAASRTISWSITWSRTIPRISGALQRSIRMRRSSRLCPPST
mgnify:CR=1 FL=1